MSGMVSRSMSLAPRRATLRRTRCGSIGITCGSCASSRARRLEIARSSATSASRTTRTFRALRFRLSSWSSETANPCGVNNTPTCASTMISRREPSTRRAGTTFPSRSSHTRATMRKSLLLLAGCFAVPAFAQGRVQRPMTFEDFAAVRNVGDPQVSPDGQWILYSVRTTDVAANTRTTVTKLVAANPSGLGKTISAVGHGLVIGADARQFPDANTRASEARWSPNGKRIAYITGGQLWIADVTGANARQLTRVSGGASGPVWSPAGDRIAFVTGVYPDCESDACNIERARAADTGKVKAHIADNLLYRHWTEWTAATRSHLFIVSPDGTGLRDVTSGVSYDVPPGPFGGSEAYNFSPDGRELAYTAKDQGREDAWSTDLNVYVVPVSGGVPTAITASNRGADQNPVYSPD